MLTFKTQALSLDRLVAHTQNLSEFDPARDFHREERLFLQETVFPSFTFIKYQRHLIPVNKWGYLLALDQIYDRYVKAENRETNALFYVNYIEFQHLGDVFVHILNFADEPEKVLAYLFDKLNRDSDEARHFLQYITGSCSARYTPAIGLDVSLKKDFLSGYITISDIFKGFPYELKALALSTLGDYVFYQNKIQTQNELFTACHKMIEAFNHSAESDDGFVNRLAIFRSTFQDISEAT